MSDVLVDHMDFDELVIAIGDGADPEVFTARCTLNAQKGWNRTAETNSVTIPYCGNDKKPGAVVKTVTALNGEVSGSGTYERGDQQFFDEWLESGETKNVRIMSGLAANGGGRQYDCAMLLTSIGSSVESKGVVQAEMTFESTGAITSSAIAAA